MPNVAKDNAPSTANPPSEKKGGKDTTVPATVLRDIRNAAAFLALVNVYGQGITGEKAMEKEVAKHFFGDESSGLASTLKLLLTGGAHHIVCSALCKRRAYRLIFNIAQKKELYGGQHRAPPFYVEKVVMSSILHRAPPSGER